MIFDSLGRYEKWKKRFTTIREDRTFWPWFTKRWHYFKTLKVCHCFLNKIWIVVIFVVETYWPRYVVEGNNFLSKNSISINIKLFLLWKRNRQPCEKLGDAIKIIFFEPFYSNYMVNNLIQANDTGRMGNIEGNSLRKCG